MRFFLLASLFALPNALVAQTKLSCGTSSYDLSNYTLIAVDEGNQTKKFYGKIGSEDEMHLIIQHIANGVTDAITTYKLMSNSVENTAIYDNSLTVDYDDDDEIISVDLTMYANKHHDFDKTQNSCSSKVAPIQTTESVLNIVFKDIDVAKKAFDYLRRNDDAE